MSIDMDRNEQATRDWDWPVVSIEAMFELDRALATAR
jgi:hypothetical protein